MLQRNRRHAVTLILTGCCIAFSVRPLAAEEAPPPAPAAEAPAAPPDTAAQIDALLGRPELDPTLRMQLDLYKMINQRRAEKGLPPLALDERLEASAGEHAADMAAGRYCRHNGRDGSTSRARIRKHGYPFNNWAGENIICSRRTPEAAMAWWMNSGPHRRNILHRHFTHIGIGVDPNGPHGPMWTLNFGAGASDTVPPAFLANPPLQVVAAPPPPAPETVAAQPAEQAAPAPAEGGAPPPADTAAKDAAVAGAPSPAAPPGAP